jgi:hypothetical protein
VENKPKMPDGFVSLKSLKQPAATTAGADAVLAEIRQIYFKTSARTIDADWAHAIELLKRLPTEEERERATVFMHGLDEMRRQWERKRAQRSPKTAANRSKKATN